MTADRSGYPAQVSLRVDPAEPEALARVARELGISLPLEPNTVSGDAGARHSLWLGPDEWLVVGSAGTEQVIEHALRKALDGRYAAITDVSASRRALEISGRAARETLEGGCSLDLHPRRFGTGQCAQTLVARANVILHQLTDEPRYRVYVRPSFAAYLSSWLADAQPSLTTRWLLT